MNTRRHHRYRRQRTYVVASLAATVLLVLLVAPSFLGVRWLDMQTASMGTTAPVGSLVITHGVDFDDINVGDVISFTRSGSDAPYTHRVVARGIDWLETQGDETGVPDPGRRSAGDVLGRMVVDLPAAGYALRSLPIVFAGLVLSVLIGRFVLRRMRHTTLMIGGATSVCVASVLHRPFFNLVSVSTSPTDDGAAVRVANTGIFPLRAQVTDGAHVDLLPGQFGTLTATGKSISDGAVRIAPEIRMDLSWWVCFVTLCCLPFLYAIVVSYRGEPVLQGPGPVRVTRTDSRRWAASVAAGAIVTVLLVVVTALANPTNGAFAARVTNTANTAVSRTYFSCASMLAASAPTRRFAYGMRSGTTWSTADNYETDLTANVRHGRWVNAAAGAAPTRTAPAGRPCASDGYSVVNVTAGSWHLTSGVAATDTTANPNVFTIETWFKTAGVNQKIIGFGVGTAGAETQYDRHLYIGSNGRLYFGVYTTATQVISSPAAVNNNQWHHGVATLGTNGMRLYVDGALVGQNAAITTGEVYTGQWRIGYGNLTAWVDATSSALPFIGSLGFTSVSYETITATEARDRYLAGLPQ